MKADNRQMPKLEYCLHMLKLISHPQPVMLTVCIPVCEIYKNRSLINDVCSNENAIGVNATSNPKEYEF